MVNLPTNRVQFGKTAYQDVSDPFGGRSNEDILRMYGIGTKEQLQAAASKNPLVIDINNQNLQPPTMIGEASISLQEQEDPGGTETEIIQAELIGEAPKAPKTKKGTDDPAPKTKKAGTKLYRDPTDAAYASLIDSDAGQKAAKRYFAGENVALANISEALKAYKGFKDTEMDQRRKINEANVKREASKRAVELDRLKRGKILAETRQTLDAPTTERIKLLTAAIKEGTERLSRLDRADPRYQSTLEELASYQQLKDQFLNTRGIGPGIEQVSEGLSMIAGARSLPRATAQGKGN